MCVCVCARARSIRNYILSHLRSALCEYDSVCPFWLFFVFSVHVQKGDSVDADAVLVDFE